MEGSFLPLVLLIKILIRLSVKTLTRFKCVCKDWLKLIESPNFVAQHLSHSLAFNNNTFLVDKWCPFCLYGSDFEVHRPQFMGIMDLHGSIVGSCNGLLCVLHTEYFICNPATRRVKKVPKTPNSINGLLLTGFGYSRVVNDYKIVTISFSSQEVKDYRMCYHVYSLITGDWKDYTVTLLRNNLRITSGPVTANDAIFWLAETIESGEVLVVSFDIAQEVFALLKGPPQSQSPHTKDITIPIPIPILHNDKLAVLHMFYSFNAQSCSCSFDVWVPEDTCAADGGNWTKKYSVGPFTSRLRFLCILRDDLVFNLFGGPSCSPPTSPSPAFFASLYGNELREFRVSEEHGPLACLIDYTESLVPV